MMNLPFLFVACKPQNEDSKVNIELLYHSYHLEKDIQIDFELPSNFKELSVQFDEKIKKEFEIHKIIYGSHECELLRRDIFFDFKENYFQNFIVKDESFSMEPYILPFVEDFDDEPSEVESEVQLYFSFVFYFSALKEVFDLSMRIEHYLCFALFMKILCNDNISKKNPNKENDFYEMFNSNRLHKLDILNKKIKTHLVEVHLSEIASTYDNFLDFFALEIEKRDDELLEEMECNYLVCIKLRNFLKKNGFNNFSARDLLDELITDEFYTNPIKNCIIHFNHFFKRILNNSTNQNILPQICCAIKELQDMVHGSYFCKIKELPDFSKLYELLFELKEYLNDMKFVFKDKKILVDTLEKIRNEIEQVFTKTFS